MWLLFIFTVFNLILLWGVIKIIKLIKKEENLSFIVVVCYLMVLAWTYIPLSKGLTNNKNELKRFKETYKTTEYLIKTYDKNSDVNGDILLDIKRKVSYINNTINEEKEGLNKVLVKECYVQEIADTEPIKFDYNNLIKEKNYE